MMTSPRLLTNPRLAPLRIKARFSCTSCGQHSQAIDEGDWPARKDQKNLTGEGAVQEVFVN